MHGQRAALAGTYSSHPLEMSWEWLGSIGLAGALGDMQNKPRSDGGVVTESGGAKYSLNAVSDGNCFKTQGS